MPRPRKNPLPINNGPVDVPEPPTVTKRAPNAEKFPEAYQSTGVPIEQVKLDRPFGAGADYPSGTIAIRYNDPSTGRTFTFTWSDSNIDAIEGFCDMLDERGYLPCASPDAPRESVSKQRDPLDEDKAVGRKARASTRKPVQSRFEDEDEDEDEDDSPTLNFGKYNGQTVAQVYHSGKRGAQYVEWLADNARQRDIRKAAQSLID